MMVTCYIFKANRYIIWVVSPDGTVFSQIKDVSETSEVQI